MAFLPSSQRKAAYVFGFIFVAVILVVALFIPRPTEFQFFVFRIVLALAAAGVAATIPGFINVDISTWVRAGGAIAVFVVIYFFSPAQLISEPPAQKVHEGFLFALRDHLNKNVSLEEFQLALAGEKTDELERFWIKEVAGKSWGELFQKICIAYQACLRCNPAPDQIKNRVRIELSGALLQGKTNEGAVMYSCSQ
ncbi:MAG: hypothetical protein ACREKR_05135 [Candidatus Methylomirabilales bacterium]